MADFLRNLLGKLDQASGGSRRPTYRVPALWHRWEYTGRVKRIGKEIVVDPYHYLAECIQRVIMPAMPGRGLGGKSLSQILRTPHGVYPPRRALRTSSHSPLTPHPSLPRRGGDWIRAGCIYGMMVRTTTAWDHDGDGDLSSQHFTETGTFLKSILLLPLLGQMGVNVIYLLPISRHSDLFKKGELGCPYAAKSFTQIEPRLHDRLLNRTPHAKWGAMRRRLPPARVEPDEVSDDSDVEPEFGAFVEAAHRIGMRVMVDLAPRTAARDHDWILEHPEWFYWIDRRFADRYGSPRIPGADYANPIASRLHEVYAPRAVREHLAMFRHAPGVTAPQRWRSFRAQAKDKPPRDLVAAIAREFGVMTPPGFSDCINDPQPPWSDVTYLRMYLDHPVAAVQHLNDPAEQPPYVLFDTAKASLFPGRKPNAALWKALAGILPWYQRFGIDGARIDMAHALPRELERTILGAARRIDPDFCFMAEELGTKNHAKVRRAGYNIMIGPSWWMEPRAHQGDMHKFVHQVLPGLKTPVLAAAEIADTPRAATRKGGARFARCMAVLNNFLPNAVPFINSGFECLERQPMNLGLDAKPRDRCALPKGDPFYGKLAFFNPYVLHWTNKGAEEMVELLSSAAAVRRRYLAEVTRPSRFFRPRISTPRVYPPGRAEEGACGVGRVRRSRPKTRQGLGRILAIGVRLDRDRTSLIVTADLDFNSLNWMICRPDKT